MKCDLFKRAYSGESFLTDTSISLVIRIEILAHLVSDGSGVRGRLL